MSFKSLFVKYHLLNWTRTKMKHRNHPWSLQNQKSTFTVKFSPCSCLEVTFLFLFVSRAELQPFILVHPGLALIFIFRLRPQPLRPTTEISRLLWFSVVANSKICRGRSRNSSATSFRSCHFFSSTSDKPNSQTKYIALLTSLRKGTLSYRHA